MPVEKPTARPPRDGLIRAHPKIVLRAASDGAAMPSLVGHFAVFNEWAEIDSWYEGNFLESIAPGAFSKTMQEGRAGMRCLFQHGMEFVQGDKPLGSISDVREDDVGGAYEVALFDAPYVRELLPGLEAGVYGASFRFSVIREEFNEKPEPSDYNPQGLPECVLKECRVPEFGPVTWGAYPSATAGLRSMTDEFMVLRAARDPERLAEMLERAANPERLEQLAARSATKRRRGQRMDSEDVGTIAGMLQLASQYVDDQDEADEGGAVTSMQTIQQSLVDLMNAEAAEVEPPEPEENAATPVGETRDAATAPPEGAGREATPSPGAAITPEEATPAAANKPKETRMTLQELLDRQDAIRSRLTEIDDEHGDAELPDDAQREHDELSTEQRGITERADRIKARQDERRAAIKDDGVGVVQREGGADFSTRRPDREAKPYDFPSVRSRAMGASSDEGRAAVWRDAALRAIDQEDGSSNPDADWDAAKKHITGLVRRQAVVEGQRQDIAERILATGSEEYRRAFAKAIAGAPQTPEEQRALATFTGAAGGFAVPYQLDPTLIPTSNHSVNPLRAMARVETVVTNEWRGVTTGAVVASYAPEGTEASDNTPTLAQPVANPERCQAFVPFTIEIEGDWPAALTELAGLIADGKDDVEATKFTLGAGHVSQEPQGLLVGATATTATAGVGAVAVADLYNVWAALPPRFRPRGKWMANLAMWDRIRQYDTAGGANLFMQNLQAGFMNQVADAPGGLGVPFLGRPAYESSAMASTITTGSKVLTVGDFRYFLIVDRMGMNVEIIQNLVGTNHRPTGTRGLYCIWRNTSLVLAPQAFQTLVTA